MKFWRFSHKIVIPYDNLLLKYGTIIDHPEVYLHPPQDQGSRRPVVAVTWLQRGKDQSYGMWDTI